MSRTKAAATPTPTPALTPAPTPASTPTPTIFKADQELAAKKKDEAARKKAEADERKRAADEKKKADERTANIRDTKLALARVEDCKCDSNVADFQCKCFLCGVSKCCANVVFGDDDDDDDRAWLNKEWKTLRRTNGTSWCPKCAKTDGPKHHPTSNNATETTNSKARKRKGTTSTDKKTKKAKAKAKAELAAKLAKLQLAPVVAAKPAEGGDAVVEASELTRRRHLEKIGQSERNAEQLLEGAPSSAFASYCKEFLGAEYLDLTLQQRSNLRGIIKALDDRLDKHVENHNKIGASTQASYVWQYVRRNMAAMIILKAYAGKVDVDKDAGVDEYSCLLPPPRRFVEVTKEDWESSKSERAVLFGSYLVWNCRAKQWIRSGKAVDVLTRIKEHIRDKDKHEKASAFYDEWRDEWDNLEWYTSLAFGEKQQLDAAVDLMDIQAIVKEKLEKAKWGGKGKAYDDRRSEMFAYLSELVDDLMMDKRQTRSSHAPGFEGPLGVHVKAR